MANQGCQNGFYSLCRPCEINLVCELFPVFSTEGLTYAAIGKKLRMTKEKAGVLYNHHYHVLYFQLSGRIMEVTGDMDLHNKYRKAFRVGSGKKKYDCLVEDYPELCENFLKGKNKSENGQGRRKKPIPSVLVFNAPYLAPCSVAVPAVPAARYCKRSF